MVRVQIYLEEDVNRALEARARRRGVSKASLIRDAISRDVEPQIPAASDAWDKLIGLAGDLGGPIGDIDTILYGPIRE